MSSNASAHPDVMPATNPRAIQGAGAEPSVYDPAGPPPSAAPQAEVVSNPHHVRHAGCVARPKTQNALKPRTL